MDPDVPACPDPWTSDEATEMSMKGDSPECEFPSGARELRSSGAIRELIR